MPSGVSRVASFDAFDKSTTAAREKRVARRGKRTAAESLQKHTLVRYLSLSLSLCARSPDGERELFPSALCRAGLSDLSSLLALVAEHTATLPSAGHFGAAPRRRRRRRLLIGTPDVAARVDR